MLDTSVKNGTSEEIVKFVETETAKRRGIASQLRTAVQPGGLFSVPKGDSFDERLVAAAIFAVLIDDINVYNQPQRERQMAEFTTALQKFDLTIDDVFLVQRKRDVVVELVSTKGDDS